MGQKRLSDIKRRFKAIKPLKREASIMMSHGGIDRSRYFIASGMEDDKPYHDFIENVYGDVAYLIDMLDKAIEEIKSAKE